MLLTIAIPTFRRPDMLADCIESLLPQLCEGVELLVIDNDPEGSARETVERCAHARLRYAHERRAGVVQARNRAAADSTGRYLGFIDDDEIARPGWVTALMRHAELGLPASFGMVVPRFLGPIAPGLQTLLDDLYTRDLKCGADSDISDKWIHVGTGNSLFDKARCFSGPTPFSAHLNGTGGEDIWLVRSLVEQGIPIHWNPAAVVDEQIPPERSTLDYVRNRKFRHGQQRIIMMRGEGGAKGLVRATAWMGIGAAQLVLHTSHALALRACGRPEWRAAAVRASGGRGKLLSWKLWDKRPYASV